MDETVGTSKFLGTESLQPCVIDANVANTSWRSLTRIQTPLNPNLSCDLGGTMWRARHVDLATTTSPLFL